MNFVRHWVNWEEYLREEHPDRAADVSQASSRCLERDLRPVHARVRRQGSRHRARRDRRSRPRNRQGRVRHFPPMSGATPRRETSVAGRWRARCNFSSCWSAPSARDGGTAPNAANKFIPAPPLMPPPAKVWNELLIPPGVSAGVFRDELLAAALSQRRARQAGDVFHPRLQPGVDQSRRHELDRNAFATKAKSSATLV